MIICRRCNEWKPLSAFAISKRSTCKVCRTCISKANATHYKAVVKTRRIGASIGALNDREKFEQVIARLDSGDSTRFACERVGVDEADFETWRRNQRTAIQESEAGLSLAGVMREAGMRK